MRVVNIIFSNGFEFIGELVSETEHIIMIRNPLNFADMSLFSTFAQESTFTFYKNTLLTYYPVRDSIVKLYYKKLEYYERDNADDIVDKVIDKLLDDFEKNFVKTDDEKKEKNSEKSLEEISSVLQNFNVPISKKLN